MTSVSKETEERVKHVVLNARIMRLTTEETAKYLAEKGLPSSMRTVYRYHGRIKKDADAWIKNLAASRQNDYIATYKERIDELEKYQRELWNIYYDKNSRQHVKVESIKALIDCSQRIMEIYDRLPTMSMIKPFGNDFKQQQQEQQQMLEQKLEEEAEAVF